LDTRLDPHISYFSATAGNRVGIGKRVNFYLIQSPRIESCVPTRDDLMLFIRRRVRQKDLQQKAIELRFR
jgi:hypothetical protein